MKHTTFSLGAGSGNVPHQRFRYHSRRLGRLTSKFKILADKSDLYLVTFRFIFCLVSLPLRTLSPTTVIPELEKQSGWDHAGIVLNMSGLLDDRGLSQKNRRDMTLEDKLHPKTNKN